MMNYLVFIEVVLELFLIWWFFKLFIFSVLWSMVIKVYVKFNNIILGIVF